MADILSGLGAFGAGVSEEIATQAAERRKQRAAVELENLRQQGQSSLERQRSASLERLARLRDEAAQVPSEELVNALSAVNPSMAAVFKPRAPEPGAEGPTAPPQVTLPPRVHPNTFNIYLEGLREQEKQRHEAAQMSQWAPLFRQLGVPMPGGEGGAPGGGGAGLQMPGDLETELSVKTPFGTISGKRPRAAKELAGTDRTLASELRQKYPNLSMNPDEWTPEQAKAFNALRAAYQAESAGKKAETVMPFQIRVGEVRGAAYGANRPIAVVDTETGNTRSIRQSKLEELDAAEPGRYQLAGPGVRAGSTLAQIADIKQGIANLRQSIQSLPPFNPVARAQLVAALRDVDPRAGLDAFLSSSAMTTLTPAQQDYVIDVRSMVERGMSLRNVLQAGGQGSDMLRSAFIATFPGATTPSREYGLKQLARAEQMLTTLKSGVAGRAFGATRAIEENPPEKLTTPSKGATVVPATATDAAALQQLPAFKQAKEGDTFTFRHQRWVKHNDAAIPQ